MLIFFLLDFFLLRLRFPFLHNFTPSLDSQFKLKSSVHLLICVGEHCCWWRWRWRQQQRQRWTSSFASIKTLHQHHFHRTNQLRRSIFIYMRYFLWSHIQQQMFISPNTNALKNANAVLLLLLLFIFYLISFPFYVFHFQWKCSFIMDGCCLVRKCLSFDKKNTFDNWKWTWCVFSSSSCAGH